MSGDENEWLFHPVESGLASHHLLFMRTLDALHRGEFMNCMIFAPPGSAKSAYGSVVFPAYVMGEQKMARVIMASYASDIARKQSRRTRQIVRSAKYRPVFGAGLVGGNEAVDAWALDNGSEYMAGGILAGVTGNRATHLLIDDPVSGREDADSATIRKKTREAYEDDLTTRLMPGAKTLIIQTRWHQDDLAGGLLPKGWDGESGLMRGQDGQDWMVVCLPAIADRPDDPLGRKIGQPLWPEWFTGGHFDRYRANARTWSSLFQQKPTPEDGDYFRREMFRWYAARPKQLRVYGASDFAVTDGGGDFTVHGIFGVDPTGAIYVLDWWRGQTSSDVWIDELLTMADRWSVVKWFGEAGPIRRAIEPYLRKRMQERGKYISLDWLASVADKPTRARSIQGRIAQGMVYFPADKPWAQDVMSQCLRFPNTDDDDDVDVLSLIGRGIDGMVNAKPEAKQRKPAPQPGSIEWVLANSREEKQSSSYR
ncbi:MAG: phage terminase large subunit [Hydrogenophaga sp.]|nr:phage terminase large subunit [Hydrogenophaga sp.]